MSVFDVKKTMEQVHMSEEMREDIIMNIQNQMENGKKRTWNWRKTAAAAAFVLAAAMVSFPVQAVVKSVVKARMENIPKEEVQDVAGMIQGQTAQSDGFSREYSDKESARSKELWQLYENGTFPEKAVLQVDNAEAVTEGTLCYIRAAGEFYLPDREMTDEEILEIIDFQHEMNYAVEQSLTAKNLLTQEQIDAEILEERAILEGKVRAAGGISEEKAIEIARKAMENDIGEKGEKLKLHTDDIYGWNADLDDISDWDEYKDKGGIAYFVQFDDFVNGMDLKDMTSYHCVINAVDGSILDAYEMVRSENDWDVIHYAHNGNES